VEPEAILHQKLAQLRRRLRLLVTQRWVALALTYAAGAGCLLALIARVRWAPAAVDWIGAALILGAMVGLVIGWTRAVTTLTAAQLADERLDLKERISTGVLLAASADSDDMALAQLADAARSARSVHPAQAFPWRLPRLARWLSAIVGLLL
jgi:hypothetical protein